MKAKNITLIGMPGVGKSTIGVILAKILGYEFIDSDLLIQKQTGKLLRELIAEVGTEQFLSIENDVHINLKVTNSIIATGGSAVYCKEAMEYLSTMSTILYLKIDYPSLKKRLGNLTARGVVLKEQQTLFDLYQERTSLYEQYAHKTIDETNLGVEETIEEILKLLTK